MKRICRILGCLMLAGCLLLTAAAAQSATVTPLPPATQMDQLAGLSLLAVPGCYDPETQLLWLTLREPLAFSGGQLAALVPGDCLTLGEELCRVVSVGWNDFGCCVCVDDAFGEKEIFFYEEDGRWLPTHHGGLFWQQVGQGAFALADQMIFWEGIVPESGDSLEEPLALTAEDFLRQKALEESDETAGPGFGCSNTKVAFDENGQISQIWRYCVPWQ